MGNTGGDWERQTDQAIRETSMSREIEADTETRDLVSRETTVKAMDKTTVIGTAFLMTGAIQHVKTESYSVAAQEGQQITVGGSAVIKVGQALTEKIDQLRQSIVGTHQEIIAPVVRIGSKKINVAHLMLDTMALVQQLTDQLASHTHPSTGQPTNSSTIAQSYQQATALSTKYSPVIGN